MKPNDLYKLVPISVSSDPFLLRHWFESSIDFYRINADICPGLEIKHYADHCFDGERTWEMASVWFDNKPSIYDYSVWW